MRTARVVAMALAMTLSTGALAGRAAAAGEAPRSPPPSAEDVTPDDDTIVAPWDRGNAGEPEAGVDDDPTPFNPSDAPENPLDQGTDPLPE